MYCEAYHLFSFTCYLVHMRYPLVGKHILKSFRLKDNKIWVGTSEGNLSLSFLNILSNNRMRRVSRERIYENRGLMLPTTRQHGLVVVSGGKKEYLLSFCHHCHSFSSNVEDSLLLEKSRVFQKEGKDGQIGEKSEEMLLWFSGSSQWVTILGDQWSNFFLFLSFIQSKEYFKRGN